MKKNHAKSNLKLEGIVKKIKIANRNKHEILSTKKIIQTNPSDT